MTPGLHFILLRWSKTFFFSDGTCLSFRFFGEKGNESVDAGDSDAKRERSMPHDKKHSTLNRTTHTHTQELNKILPLFSSDPVRQNLIRTRKTRRVARRRKKSSLDQSIYYFFEDVMYYRIFCVQAFPQKWKKCT